jgi:serine/threonine-protein kinase
MVTGRPPFRAETPPVIFVKHLHDPLLPPRALNPDISESLELVILKALTKNPDNRFENAENMVRAIQAAIPELRVGETIIEAIDYDLTMIERSAAEPQFGDVTADDLVVIQEPLELKKTGMFGLSRNLLMVTLSGASIILVLSITYLFVSGLISNGEIKNGEETATAPSVNPVPKASVTPKSTSTEVVPSATPTQLAEVVTVSTPETLSAIITNPEEGSSVGHKVDVQGVISLLEPGMHAFICIRSTVFERFIWPQGEKGRARNVLQKLVDDIGTIEETADLKDAKALLDELSEHHR